MPFCCCKGSRLCFNRHVSWCWPEASMRRMTEPRDIQHPTSARSTWQGPGKALVLASSGAKVYFLQLQRARRTSQTTASSWLVVVIRPDPSTLRWRTCGCGRLAHGGWGSWEELLGIRAGERASVFSFFGANSSLQWKTASFGQVRVHMVVVLNSFVSKRPFFANKKVTFANLSRIHRRALFLAQVRKSLILSASVVREIRFPNSSCKVATFITGVLHDMHGLERRSFA